MTPPDSTRSRAALLVAHGSRVDAANAAHLERCRSLDRRLDGVTVSPAFLELTGPTVPDVIDELAAEGYEEITVHPFFLHGGRHTLVDLPEILGAARRRHPEVAFALGDHLGGRPELDEMLVTIIENEHA